MGICHMALMCFETVRVPCLGAWKNEFPICWLAYLLLSSTFARVWNLQYPRRCKISAWTTSPRTVGQCASQLLLGKNRNSKNYTTTDLKLNSLIGTSGVIHGITHSTRGAAPVSRIEVGLLYWLWLHVGQACEDGGRDLWFESFAASCLHKARVFHCAVQFLSSWSVTCVQWVSLNTLMHQGRIGSMVFTSELWHAVLHCPVRFHGWRYLFGIVSMIPHTS